MPSYLLPYVPHPLSFCLCLFAIPPSPPPSHPLSQLSLPTRPFSCSISSPPLSLSLSVSVCLFVSLFLFFLSRTRYPNPKAISASTYWSCFVLRLRCLVLNGGQIADHATIGWIYRNSTREHYSILRKSSSYISQSSRNSTRKH